MLRFLCFCCAAAIACAQNFEVRGSITDPGFNLGVAGTEVTLYEFVLDPTNTVTRRAVARMPTDVNGGFRFALDHAGDYYIEGRKDGYTPAAGGMGRTDDLVEARVTLTRDTPSQEFKFTLTRPGAIRGRVLSTDGKPAPNFRVQVRSGTLAPGAAGIAQVVEQHGVLVNTNAVTDSDGVFTATKLPPGDYILRLVPGPSAEGITVMTKFSEDDAKAVDQSFEETSIPVRVASGSTSNAGTMSLAGRVELYRARVRVRSERCDADERWSFTAGTNSLLESATIGRVACTAEFLVRNLKPGSYSFQLWNDAKWGVAPAEVRRGNVEVDLTMNAAVSLSGRLVAAQDATLPALKPLHIEVTGARRAAPDEEGKFQVTGLEWQAHSVLVDGLPREDYVKEIRYNGAPVPGGNFSLSAGAGQTLELVIDDKAASVEGVALEADQPSHGARIILAKWPIEGSGPMSVWSKLADSGGRFEFSGLAPGEYRVAAVPQGWFGNQTQVLEYGEKVTLEPRSSQSLRLKVTKP